ncbi:HYPOTHETICAL PROTEIN MCJ_005230 [Mesomycoplasma conjunctivae]|uniref:Uncharacterized protein n=1 Tax=Mesomycoplasma conjunctivae (strain ATCC 25834 / NCTC 10147 / HRC/581) TaxID=572263 RepID=C5J6V9_MESCH|nr:HYPOTHETICAL PROTEIN MCJ_005230 [Mesomycoplasma conjunctivae]
MSEPQPDALATSPHLPININILTFFLKIKTIMFSFFTSESKIETQH